MNLSKAKEIIDINIKERSPRMPPDVLEALKLHSEASKYLLHLRDCNYPDILLLLPGETEE